jgi:hypothetical protein
VRRFLPFVAIAACLVVGAVLIALAVDVNRWRGDMETSDVVYRGAPQSDLWHPATLAPAGLTSAILGVGDDVAYRRAVRAFRLSHPEAPSVSDPSLVLERNDAIVRLTYIVLHDRNSGRRSMAANLLGILNYSDAVYDYTNRATLISNAAQRFGQSIGFDPANDDAKYNLELTQALARGIGLSESGGGTNPSPGGKGSKGAGAAEPGSGY